MGFRNIRDFNIALLGNQDWRLLQYPDKLVSKIYRARYYHHGSFLNASLGHNPSYIWRSVLESKNVIQRGIGCRVGNSQSISIIGDPWLPVENDAYVHTGSESIKNQKVSSLISISSNNLDNDLILDVFESKYANLIFSIPLNNAAEDSWYWRREKLGNYSLKSAYLLLQELKNGQNTTPNSGFWRKLWNLKIPNKVKKNYGVLLLIVFLLKIC